MVKLIIGVKGTGKTKTLIEMVHTALDHSKGKVVCIEKSNKLRYDINYRCRLVEADEYFVDDAQSLYGFVAGMVASDHDITDLFIDSGLKIANDDMDHRLEAQMPPEAVETLLFMHFMMDGVPFLYNGVEYCDSARHSIYSFPGQFVIDRTKGTPERKKLIQELTELRLNEPILYQGKMVWDEFSGNVLKFNRDGKIFCAINMGKAETEVQLPSRAELMFKSKNAKQNNAVIQLPQYGFAAYKIKE